MNANGKCLAFSLIFLMCLGLVVRAESAEVRPKPDAMKIQSAPVLQHIPRTDIALYDVTVKDDCRLWVTWQNTGNQMIDAHLKERVTVSGVSIPGESMNHVVINPGAYFSHGVGADPGVKLQGMRTVTAVIDFDNVLKESNETNNTLVKTLTCGQ